MNRQVMDAIVSMVFSYVHLLMETICNINVVLFASVNSKTIHLIIFKMLLIAELN